MSHIFIKRENSADDSVVRRYQNIQLSADAIDFIFEPRFSDSLRVTAERAAKTYNVTPSEAIEEFRRLLAIKTLVFDIDAVKISPTPLMDQMWHAAVLDTRFYEDLQIALGQKLHHRPSGAYAQEDEQRERRLSTMKSLYRTFFTGEPLPPALLRVNHAPVNAAPVNPRHDVAKFSISLSTPCGQTFSCDIKYQGVQIVAST